MFSLRSLLYLYSKTGLIISLRVPYVTVSTEESHNAKVDSANEPASTLSSNEGKDAGEIMARCASDGDASDARCAKPFHIHHFVTEEHRIDISS